jgi:2,4-dienoyl-CoA reductase-like NADH-dependent reductase (Old Yellow Enzyme family)
MVAVVQAPKQLLRGVLAREAVSSSPVPDEGLFLVPMAVVPAGRRFGDASSVPSWVLRLSQLDEETRRRVVVVLDHAGPAASTWSSERAVGPADVPEVRTGRRPAALTDDEWAELARKFQHAAELCTQHLKVGCALGVDDDGLLHATLSPRTNPGASDEERLARVLAIHRACGPVDVLLCVEELAPLGLDATDGITAARALVAQGARRIYASSGTAALPALRRREKGETADGAVNALASAAWLVRRVGAEIVAVVPPGGDDAARAAALGLAGVVVESA